MLNALDLIRNYENSASERESRRTLAELAQRKFMAEQEMQPGRMEEQRLSNLAKLTQLQNYGPELERKRQAEANSQNLMRERLGVMERMNAAKIAAAEKRGGVALKEKAPPGYRFKDDGSLEAIPGGPADLKQQGAFNQDSAALTGGMSAMDRLATAANEAMNHPGLAGITGLRGALPNIPGGEAADAQAKLNTLKSQVAFGVLQDMRNNSKTGGALGSVSDAEGKRLEANLAALEKSQSYEAMKDSLKKIVEYASGAKDRLNGAFNLKHGDKSRPQSGMSSQDAEAMAWATANPTDPRAAEIKRRLGGR